MLEVTLVMTNDNADAFARELRAFIDARLVPKVTGEKNDRRDTATPAYVVARTLLKEITTHQQRCKEKGQADGTKAERRRGR